MKTRVYTENRNRKSKTWLWILLAIILTAVTTGGLMYWWQLRSIENTRSDASTDKKQIQDDMNLQISELEKRIENLESDLNICNGKLEEANEKAETATATTNTTTDSNPNNTDSQFQSAIDKSDKSKAQSLIVNIINLTEEATSCCGDLPASQAAEVATTYLAKQTPFNWSQDQQVVKSIKSNYSEFANYTIGIGTDSVVFAYHKNASEKIDKIYMSVSSQLFDLE